MSLNSDGHKNIGEFLQNEIRQRGMNNHQFAEFVGVEPQVMDKLLEDDFKSTGYPSIKVMVKLSKVLDVDIGRIIALIEPDATNIRERARLLAQWIEQLPPEQQQIIDQFLLDRKKELENSSE